MTSVFHYEAGAIELMAFFCSYLDGAVSLNVHADARWISVQDLPGFDFAPADVPIVLKLIALQESKTDKR